jgi:hypothetical protein
VTGAGGARLTRAPDILSRSCLTTVLVRLRGAPTVGLVGAAAEVWELLDVERSVAEVAERLAERHGTTAAEVLRELPRLADELLALGVVWSAAGAPQPPAG